MNLEKLRMPAAIMIVAAITNIFTVAFSIFLLQRQLFYSLDLWRMLTISVAIALPCMLGAFMVFSMIEYDPKAKPKQSKEPDSFLNSGIHTWGVSIVFTIIAMNVHLIYTYLFLHPKTLKDYYSGLVLIYSFFILITAIRSIILRWKWRNKTN
jgi:hypothetical protein